MIIPRESCLAVSPGTQNVAYLVPSDRFESEIFPKRKKKEVLVISEGGIDGECQHGAKRIKGLPVTIHHSHGCDVAGMNSSTVEDWDFAAGMNATVQRKRRMSDFMKYDTVFF